MDDAAGSIGKMEKKKKMEGKQCLCILWDLPNWVAIPPVEGEQASVPLQNRAGVYTAWKGALH